MYETPLFLAHEEESGGRSVPTTPLQVAAPGKYHRQTGRLCAFLVKWEPVKHLLAKDLVSHQVKVVVSFHFKVTVFTESTTSDASEHASQSVPMVTTSTGTLSTTNETATGDDGDEVFVEAESEG